MRPNIFNSSFFHLGLEVGQGPPSRVNLGLALALFDVQIGAALGAQPAAVFAAQHATGKTQFQLL